ncbi:MAG: hypothetical protein ABSB94_20405 [Syntrophorhabdales bacterium]|jgi:hypothetical protein
MHSRVDQFMETARKEMKNELSQTFLKLFSSGFPVMRQIALSSFPDPAAAESYARSISRRLLPVIKERKLFLFCFYCCNALFEVVIVR